MERQLSEKYKSKLVKLTIPGVDKYGWMREILLAFVSDEESLHFSILGGHVVEINNSEMKYNYDNWYIDGRKPEESFSDYCKRSNIITQNYLAKYPIKSNVLFVVNMTSEITAGL